MRPVKGFVPERPPSPPPVELKLNYPKDSNKSWLACFCAFQSQVFITGTLHGFGVFFVEFTKEFKTSKGNAAWISSLAYGLSMLAGPIASILTNKFEQRYVMMTGCGLCSLALLSSSFVTSFSVLFLSFSFIFGMGASLAITCTVTVSQEYFDNNVTIAMGIIAAGSSFGTLIMSPFSQYLVDSVGWRNAFRALAGTSGLSMMCNMMLIPIQPREKSTVSKVRTSPLRKLMEDLKLWRNRVFVIWTSAITCVMFGYYIPYVHMVSYATDCGIKPSKAALLLTVMGASTAFGRILFGKIVEIGLLDRIRMHQLSMVISGAGTMFLPSITTFSGLAIYIVIIGLVDGCYIVLMPLLTCSLVGSDNMVLAWGFLVGTSSITFALGPPVAGFIYDSTGSYNLAFHMAGIPILTGAILMFFIPWAQRTSQTTNVFKELVVPQPDAQDDLETVDFITMSRVPSLVSAVLSKSALDHSRKDNETVQESGSLVEADWGAYFVNNLNQMTIVQGNTTVRAGMREADFDLSALERTDQVLSEMLKGGNSPSSQSIRLSGPALIVNNSPKCQSCKNSSKKSDVINISSSRLLSGHRRSSVDIDVENMSSDVAVQTELSYINLQTPPPLRRSQESLRQVSPTSISIQTDEQPGPSSASEHEIPPAMAPSEGFISGYKGKLNEGPKGSKRVRDPLSKNRTALDMPITRLQNTIDENDTTEPLFGPGANNAGMFHTTHYTTGSDEDESNCETLPIDIPTPNYDISAKGSDIDMFHMELPPSPSEQEEHKIMLLPSPPSVSQTVPIAVDDSITTLQFTLQSPADDNRSLVSSNNIDTKFLVHSNVTGNISSTISDNGNTLQSPPDGNDSDIKFIVPSKYVTDNISTISDSGTRSSIHSDDGSNITLLSGKRTSLSSNDSNDSSGNTMPSILDDGRNMLPFTKTSDDMSSLNTDVKPSTSPIFHLFSSRRKETAFEMGQTVQTTSEVQENSPTDNRILQSIVSPAAPIVTTSRTEREGFSEYPVSTDNSPMPIRDGEIFQMDPLCPPLPIPIPSRSPSPAQTMVSSPYMETYAHSNHDNTAYTSLKGQTVSRDDTQQRSSPVGSSQGSNQQIAPSSSTSQGSHSNLIFKMDSVVRDSQSDTSKSSEHENDSN